MVCARRGPQPIERVGDDGDRRVEADAVISLGEVVVDRLGHADHSHAVFVKPLRDAESVVAAYRDERVDPPAADALEHGTARCLVLSRVGARRAQHRPALTEDAHHVSDPEGSRLGLAEQSGPAVRDPYELVTLRRRSQDDRPDRRVQTRSVASSGEYTDAQGLRATHPTKD